MTLYELDIVYASVAYNNLKKRYLFFFQAVPSNPLLGECHAVRTFLPPGVRRIPYREGRVRGTLFMPPQPPSLSEKLPLVVTAYGGIHRGNVIEEKAALLAGKGEEFIQVMRAFLQSC